MQTRSIMQRKEAQNGTKSQVKKKEQKKKKSFVSQPIGFFGACYAWSPNGDGTPSHPTQTQPGPLLLLTRWQIIHPRGDWNRNPDTHTHTHTHTRLTERREDHQEDPSKGRPQLTIVQLSYAPEVARVGQIQTDFFQGFTSRRLLVVLMEFLLASRQGNMARPPIRLPGSSLNKQDLGCAGLDPVLLKELVDRLWVFNGLDRTQFSWIVDDLFFSVGCGG